MKPGSPADLHRRFRTGRPCLDFVHTGGEGEMARWEIVHGPDDLGRLLGVILGLPAVAATAADMAPMNALRTAITRLAYGLALGSEPDPPGAPRVNTRRAEIMQIAYRITRGPEPGRAAIEDRADIETINAAAARPPLVPALLPGGGTAVVAPTAAAALATLARDAVDLFGGSQATRIRMCAADDCGLLLVDTSRPGRRRWCSMERCGNRAKVRRHRAD
jgi:CGNR zinc finger/Putative stress-induced transcription regulator